MAAPAADPFALRLSSAAFVIVDMQNDFVRVGRPSRCRTRGRPSDPSGRSRGSSGPPVVDELAVEPGDYVVDKYGYGAFFRTNLEDILASERVDTVMIAGTVTQICVEETARESFHHGFKTVLLSDGVSSFAPDLHAATLKNFAMKFGMVMSSEEMTARLGR